VWIRAKGKGQKGNNNEKGSSADRFKKNQIRWEVKNKKKENSSSRQMEKKEQGSRGTLGRQKRGLNGSKRKR